MNRFEYLRPNSVSEAVAAGAEPGSAYLAGGTNLLDLMKAGIARPTRLVDVTRLPGLDRIERCADGALRIGALVRNATLAHDQDFVRSYPSVAEALLSGASAQLRNAATVGGNIMQRSRHVFHAALASVSDAPAIDASEEDGRYSAVLGWSKACSAVHPSDFCVPLVALDAKVEIEGNTGRREVSLENFYHLPEDSPEIATVLQPGDLITAVILPTRAGTFSPNTSYLKLRERTSYAFALVSAVACLDIEDGKIAEARIALGGVAPKPWRARSAEDLLKGEVPGEAAFRRAANVALADARPSRDNAFKIELSRRVVLRVLLSAANGSPQRLPPLPSSPFSTTPGVHQ